MLALALTYSLIRWAVTAAIMAAIALVLLRSLFNYIDVNPFTWHARNVRRATDPVITPVRRMLVAFRLDPKVAPFILIILMIVIGYLIVQIAGTLLNTIAGIVYAVTDRKLGAPLGIAGYLLFGFLGLYTLAIFVRIVLSWFGTSYATRLMRFLIRVTEPLLAPLRRTLPTVGMFDISPIVAFLIVWICQAAVAATLLHGWPITFF
ncbi:MAG TPA: YggT family protein [Pyrinomonadaceae bacterium]|nr:YggT family protein [Pyrinomonadaceae bacterium]